MKSTLINLFVSIEPLRYRRHQRCWKYWVSSLGADFFFYHNDNRQQKCIYYGSYKGDKLCFIHENLFQPTMLLHSMYLYFASIEINETVFLVRINCCHRPCKKKKKKKKKKKNVPYWLSFLQIFFLFILICMNKRNFTWNLNVLFFISGLVCVWPFCTKTPFH